MLSLFLKSVIIGFAIAAPVGPIGILCIQRSLHDGFKVGLMTGMGAALADGVYGLIAGLSLTAVSSLLVAQEFWIRLIGSLFLIYFGIKILLTPPRERTTGSHANRSPWRACVSTFFLTLANPMTILAFIAVFSGLGLANTSTDYTRALFLITGITLGSTCWWLLLSGGVAFILRHRVSHKAMQLINFISGFIILAFGLFMLVWE